MKNRIQNLRLGVFLGVMISIWAFIYVSVDNRYVEGILIIVSILGVSSTNAKCACQDTEEEEITRGGES